ncbi:hypothetical protein [Butyrivibrio sp. MB2005]|uniref:hypothetical protein n=1 Tax=Butyrivibrio sp. MB2005 TaxID=1280678 RepID=UPI0003F5572E|nr:hypothetical protein [Butyrivibrio sp. MB2005]
MILKNYYTKESLLHIAQISILTFATELLLSTIVFFIGQSISWHFFLCSFTISVIICSFSNSNSPNWCEVITALIIFVGLSCIAGLVFDYSWDGNAYHKLAVGLLRYHWNPLKSLPSLSLIEGAGEYSGNTLWVEAYGKATWIFGASIYSLSGNIENGKCYTMIAMLSAFMLVYYYMVKKKHSYTNALMMASVTAFNPISIQQMFTFYIDGFLHTMLIILVVSLLMFEDDKTFERTTSVCLIAASMIVCGNIKFTGLLYGGIFCIAYYIYDCYRLIRGDKDWLQKVLSESVAYLFLVFLTVAWGGCSTYITNVLRHGSPIYPLMGEGKVDIMSNNSPFSEENHFKNLFLSLFSRVDNFTADSGKTVELKVPFTFSFNEVVTNCDVDARVSGFGVFFGGLFIAAIIVLLICLVRSNHEIDRNLIILNVSVCVGLMFGIKESWWARYSPYIYMLLLISVFILLASDKRKKTIVATIFTVLILLNNCLPLLGIIVKNYDDSKAIDSCFRELKSYGMIEIRNKAFEGIYFNFKDYDIYYRINEELKNEDNLNTTNYRGTVWKQIKCK